MKLQPFVKERLPSVDALVIGGGVYGCAIALTLRKYLDRVMIVEGKHDILGGASFANTARIHHGYHYPRHFKTAERCSINYHRFITEFADCMDDSCEAIYAVAKTTSKISSLKFRNLCESINAPLSPAPERVTRHFDPSTIESVFCVEEPVFDANKLRESLRGKLEEAGVIIRCDAVVEKAEQSGDALVVTLAGGQRFEAGHVFNCAYSQINTIVNGSGLPLVPLKHELAEIALIEVPPELSRLSITIIDGFFFAIMPFPPTPGCHSLTHVTHTPHRSWHDTEPYKRPDECLMGTRIRSRFTHMLKNSALYIPCLERAKYRGSIFETKTMLPSHELNDGRPILFKRDYHLKNFHIVLGSKVDNIFDIAEVVDDMMSGSTRQHEFHANFNIVGLEVPAPQRS